MLVPHTQIMTNSTASTSKLKQPTTTLQKKTFTFPKPSTAISNDSNVPDYLSSTIRAPSASTTKMHSIQADRKRRIDTTDSQMPKPSIVQNSQSFLPPIPVYSSEIIDIMKKKRQGWDIKGRLQDMETLNSTLLKQIQSSVDTTEKLRQELSLNEQRIKELENFRHELQSSVTKEKQEKSTLNKELHDLYEKLKHQDVLHQQACKSMQQEYESKLNHSEWNLDNIKKALSLCREELNQAKDDVSNLKTCVSDKDSYINLLENEKHSLSNDIKRLEHIKVETLDALSLTRVELEAARERIVKLEEEFHTGELTRKRLHNEIQELKGNIRVFCRVRPLLKQDEEHESIAESDNEVPCKYSYSSDQWARTESIEVIQTSEATLGSDKQVIKNTLFSFDKVFPPPTTQNQIFEEISQLVQSALDGYRVCIFAYGQTGSGKTFTMEGPSSDSGSSMIDDPMSMGMIPRAVVQIFQSAQQLKTKGWKFLIEASFLEIYNETIYDLLVTSSEKSSKKLDIKHIPNTNRTVVQDLTVVTVACTEQVFKLLRKASENRTIGETQCNERSSRSHSVFMLQLKGENNLTSEKCEGQLNLVDLAGSERLSQSGSTGERLKETQAINKSLSSLGDVIMALANKDAHIPYRNSKLTYLLQNSLGGNSKTLMFVNISPAPQHVGETLCSLRFATKVNSCQIGTAKRVVSK